jgi:drug/metabolite transporter (DMT)-like permease
MNAISYAVFLVISRPLMKKYSPLWVLRIIFTIGAFMIIPFGWNEFNEVDWPAIKPSEWAAIAYVGILSTFAAYLLNIFSLKYITSSANGTYIYTQPVFAAMIAILFLGEELSIVKIICAALIFSGVFLVYKKQAEG